MIFILRRLRRCCISSVILLAGHIPLTHDHMELLFNGIHIESLAFLIYKVPVAFGDPLYFISPPTPPLNYKKSPKVSFMLSLYTIWYKIKWFNHHSSSSSEL